MQFTMLNKNISILVLFLNGNIRWARCFIYILNRFIEVNWEFQRVVLLTMTKIVNGGLLDPTNNLILLEKKKTNVHIECNPQSAITNEISHSCDHTWAQLQHALNWDSNIVNIVRDNSHSFITIPLWESGNT